MRNQLNQRRWIPAIKPTVNPPIWANQATPAGEPMLVKPLIHCRTNQPNMKIIAGISTISIMKSSGMAVTILARGYYIM